MDPQLKKGIVEVGVLATLMKADSYGYLIVKELSKITEISESTLYPILKRLEKGKFLTTYNVEHNGRLRKYYRITEEGKRKIDYFLKEWTHVNKVYEYIAEVTKNAEK